MSLAKKVLEKRVNVDEAIISKEQGKKDAETLVRIVGKTLPKIEKMISSGEFKKSKGFLELASTQLADVINIINQVEKSK